MLTLVIILLLGLVGLIGKGIIERRVMAIENLSPPALLRFLGLHLKNMGLKVIYLMLFLILPNIVPVLPTSVAKSYLLAWLVKSALLLGAVTIALSYLLYMWGATLEYFQKTNKSPLP